MRKRILENFAKKFGARLKRGRQLRYTRQAIPLWSTRMKKMKVRIRRHTILQDAVGLTMTVVLLAEGPDDAAGDGFGPPGDVAIPRAGS